MEHTFKAVDEELNALHGEVVRMGEVTVSQLRAAVAAFVKHDAAEAARVAAADAELDRMDAEIERRAVRFIALHQPMADDLRAPITAMKTAMNLERCGDLAKNMAKRTRELAAPPSAGQSRALADLGALVAGRLAEVMAAYSSGDAEAATRVWEKDAEVDILHERVFRDILQSMSGDPSGIEASTHLLFITKNLERIGDHATNIAELVCYEATGVELGERARG